MSEIVQTKFEGWALVEIMGNRPRPADHVGSRTWGGTASESADRARRALLAADAAVTKHLESLGYGVAGG